MRYGLLNKCDFGTGVPRPKYLQKKKLREEMPGAGLAILELILPHTYPEAYRALTGAFFT